MTATTHCGHSDRPNRHPVSDIHESKAFLHQCPLQRWLVLNVVASWWPEPVTGCLSTNESLTQW
jgi:hypothetical protein